MNTLNLKEVVMHTAPVHYPPTAEYYFGSIPILDDEFDRDAEMEIIRNDLLGLAEKVE